MMLQVPITASNSETQKHADKLQSLDEKTINIVADSTALQSQVDSSKTPDTISAAQSPIPKRQVAGSDGLSNVSQSHDLNETGRSWATMRRPVTLPLSLLCLMLTARQPAPRKMLRKPTTARAKRLKSSCSLTPRKQAQDLRPPIAAVTGRWRLHLP